MIIEIWNTKISQVWLGLGLKKRKRKKIKMFTCNEESAWKLTQKVALTHNSVKKQWIWHHLHPERAMMLFQMRHSQGMTFPIALSTSPSSPSCVSAPRIGLIPPVPHWKAWYNRPYMYPKHVFNFMGWLTCMYSVGPWNFDNNHDNGCDE
jgi:hypothetical protein